MSLGSLRLKTVMLLFYKCALKIVSGIWSNTKCSIEWGLYCCHIVVVSACLALCVYELENDRVWYGDGRLS